MKTLLITKTTINFGTSSNYWKKATIYDKITSVKESPWSWQDPQCNAKNWKAIFYKLPFANYLILFLKAVFFPSTWCEGIITPIYKSGNKNDPSNYRGICISSWKLFTSVLNARLKKHLLQQNILHQAQIGFLSNHRTSDHIFTLRTLVDKYVSHNTKGKLLIRFGMMDYSDYKLLHYKIGGNFFYLIRNLYSKCSIKNFDKRTGFFDYQKGVRQGCILSPMLFILRLSIHFSLS